MAALSQHTATRTAHRGIAARSLWTAYQQRYRLWLPIVLLWLLTRAMVLVLALALLLTSGGSLTAHSLSTLWLHYDARHYLDIAINGYHSRYLMSFFPLYPAITHLVFLGLGRAHPLVAGLVVSNVATLAACLGIARLARLEYDDDASGLASVQLFLAVPLALFLAAPWAESLLIAWSAWALACARQGRWYAAAGCALAATLTNAAGIALLAPLVYEYAHQSGGWPASRWRWMRTHPWRGAGSLREAAAGLAVALAAPLGVGAYAVLCFARFGDFLLFFHAEQAYFGHHLAWPWQTVGLVAGNVAALRGSVVGEARLALDVLPVLICAALTARIGRSMPKSFALYLVALLALCVASPVTGTLFPDVLVSAGRYLLASIPLFVVAGRWCGAHPRWRVALLAGGWALQAALTVCAFGGVWIV